MVIQDPVVAAVSRVQAGHVPPAGRDGVVEVAASANEPACDFPGIFPVPGNDDHVIRLPGTGEGVAALVFRHRTHRSLLDGYD